MATKATKKLIIRTPQTTDGISLAYDDDRNLIFKETVVEETARKHFESLNSKLPKQLRHELIDADEKGNPIEKAPAKAKAPAKGKAKDETEESEEA